MTLTEIPLRGAFIIDPERLEDERGFFARTFCRDVFRAHGLTDSFAQCNISFNRRLGTLRGLHYQADPFAEAKLVRCTTGGIWDVIVDMRHGSPTRGQWHSLELNATNRRALYVPAGFAHGFQTLTDDAEVLYQMSVPFQPAAARGIDAADASLAIAWPLPVSAMSANDRALPAFAP